MLKHNRFGVALCTDKHGKYNKLVITVVEVITCYTIATLRGVIMTTGLSANIYPITN